MTTVLEEQRSRLLSEILLQGTRAEHSVNLVRTLNQLLRSHDTEMYRRRQTGLHVKHRRPKAGDASLEGLLKVERRVFRCLGFRV